MEEGAAGQESGRACGTTRDNTSAKPFTGCNGPWPRWPCAAGCPLENAALQVAGEYCVGLRTLGLLAARPALLNISSIPASHARCIAVITALTDTAGSGGAW
jgi:hypothetical protein